MLSPRQIFEDNIRPADLLLKVFRLLEHDALNTEEDLLRPLRQLAKAEKDESHTRNFQRDIFGIDPGISGNFASIDQAQCPVQSVATGSCYRQHSDGDLPAESCYETIFRKLSSLEGETSCPRRMTI